MATAVESPPLNRTEDALTPTASHFSLPPRSSERRAPSNTSSSNTPTRESFAAIASAPPPPLPPLPPTSTSEKRPLPDDKPAADTRESTSPATTTSPAGQDSSPAPHPHEDAGDDVKMEDRKDDDLDGSDNDDNEDDDGRPAKKKRSQRFFCKEYPPCNLSFTRSEHLARHIRKHTGERPFQCHCLRRFSRLDNLRQHAQTVHLNEDIPGDSLAATGTRYQRQVRTERIRPAGHRQRASTLSAGTHSRGHSRNVSTSSIGSVSDFGSPEDPRRRPQPLLMAPSTPPRPAAGDSYGAQAGPPPYYNYPHSGYSTPSAYSAADPTSPRMSAGLASPIALAPRSAIGWGGQNSSRRLSIPSGVSPYHASHAFAMTPASPFLSQVAYPPAVPYPGPPGHPLTHFGHSRHESLESAEADWRRRTWHASTRSNVESRPATSALTYHQRPDDPQPVSTAQPAAQQAVRLPGIDSFFDRPQMQPVSRARRHTNDMDVEEASQAGDDASSKRNSWSSMHQNLHQLELTQNTPPREVNYWRHSTGSQPSSAARPMTAPHNGYAQPPQEPTGPSGTEQPSTPKRQKRAADWSYEAALADGDGGPGPAVRTSPEGSSNSDELPTPGTSAVEYRPAIVHSNGYVEGQPGGILEDPSKAQDVHRSDVPGYAPIRTSLQAEPPKAHEDTGRLDALVAVATSEECALPRQ